MRTIVPALLLAAAFAPRILCADGAAGDGFADEYLFRVGVRTGQFVSLVPTSCTNLFDKDPPRRDAWEKRVSETLDVGDVEIRPADSEVGVDERGDNGRASSPAVSWLDWVQDGDVAVSAVPSKRDGGGSFVLTNRFAIYRDQANVNDRCVRLAGGGARGLVAARGVGESIWVLPWADLEKRWNEEKNVDEVRKCWRSIYEGARCGDSTPGGPAWKRRLEEYWDKNQQLWPGIRLKNVRDEEIEVRCRERGGGAWGQAVLIEAQGDKVIGALRNPRTEYNIEWQFRPAGSNEWVDCRTHGPIMFSGLTETEITIFASDAPFKAPPKLRFGNQAVSGAEFIRLVPYVHVVYEDADGGHRTNTTEKVYPDAASTPFIQLLPGRRVKELLIDGDKDLFQKQSIGLKKVFHCGDVDDSPRLALHPWPEVTLEIGNTNQVVANAKVVLDGTEARGANAKTGWRLDSGKKETKPLSDWIGGSPPETNREASVVIHVEADGYEPWETSLVLQRGQDPVLAKIDLKPQSIPWPSSDEIKAAFRRTKVNLILRATRTTKLDLEDELTKSFQTITSGVAAEVGKHLAACRDEECKEHKALKAMLPADWAQLSDIERQIELFIALWAKAYPDQVDASYTNTLDGNKTKKERLRELLDQYVLGKPAGGGRQP